VTVRITLERVSTGEIRVTLTADIRISGDLGSLTSPQGTPAGTGDADRRDAGGAVGQELLTVEQAAEILHVSRDKVYGLIRTGQLRSIKIGKLRRISRQWITEFTDHQEHRTHA
jgi:excisionase family DNA binding protein